MEVRLLYRSAKVLMHAQPQDIVHKHTTDAETDTYIIIYAETKRGTERERDVNRQANSMHLHSSFRLLDS